MPNEYDFYSGQYPYPLNNVLSDGGLFDKTFVSGDPSLAIADEDNFYMICCTPAQMLKIISSLEVGAPIAYPNAYTDVQQLVQQAYEFPNSFGGGDCVDICSEVTNCIETNEGTQNAIFDYMVLRGSLGNGNPDGVLQEINDQIILDGSLCSEDNIFAMALQITQLVNEVITDIFEKMEAGGFLGEQIGNLVEVVPLFKELGAGELFDLVDNFFFQAFESYSANYDTSVQNQLACDLFCVIIDNDCVLNWEFVAEFYADKAIDEYTNMDLGTLVGYLATGDFGGIGWVYACYWMFWGVLSLAGKIFGYDALLVTKLLQSTTNDTNSDWEFLCSECSPYWFYVSDFLVTPNDWLPVVRYMSIPLAEWVVDEGWNSVDAQAGATQYWRGTEIGITFATPVHVNSIEMIFDLTKGSFVSDSTSYRINTFLGGSGNGTIVVNNSVATDGTDKTVVLEPDKVIDEIQVLVRSSLQSTASYSGYNKIKQVNIQGEGTIPPELE